MLWLLFLLIMMPSFSVAKPLKTYFKKCENKDGKSGYGLEGVDFIYMINLDKRIKDKFEPSAKQLAPYGIYPYRFSAINGWQLSLATINDVGVKFDPKTMKGDFQGAYYTNKGKKEALLENIAVRGRTYFSDDSTPGYIGNALSHLSILQDAYDAGYERIWVMEDDILVLRNPHLLTEAMKKLDALVGKDGWDIIFADKGMRNDDGEELVMEPSWHKPRPNVNRNPTKTNQVEMGDFIKINQRLCLHSVILQRPYIKKLLDAAEEKRLFLAWDWEVWYLVPRARMFSIKDSIITREVGTPRDTL